MASRLLTRSTAAVFLSHFRSRTPNPIHHLLPHGAAMSSFLGPAHALSAAARSCPLLGPIRWFSSPAPVVEAPRTADGLTVDSIADKGWTILAESESDWRSHAAAVAQSIRLIKKRLKVQSLSDTRCSHILVYT